MEGRRQGTTAWGLMARGGEDQIVTALSVSLLVFTREMFPLEMVRVKSCAVLKFFTWVNLESLGALVKFVSRLSGDRLTARRPYMEPGSPLPAPLPPQTRALGWLGPHR